MSENFPHIDNVSVHNIPSKMKPVLLMAFLFIYTGCAVMSTTVLETAETVDPGHFKIGLDGGIGIDLVSPVFFQDDTNNVNNDHELNAFPVSGLKIGFGVAEDYEINAKYWLVLGDIGIKLYIKHQLSPLSDNTFIAVLPGISYLLTGSEDDTSSSANEYPRATAYGINLPIIMSHRFNEYFTMYGSVRYSLNRVHVSKSETMDFYGTYMVNRLGIITGISIEPRLFYIRLEIGLECAKMVNGGYGYLPIVGTGIGLEF